MQFYPTSDDQIQLITSIAQKAGFGGGVVVDYPNSKKAKKVFLCLFVGGGGAQQQVPEGLDGDEVEGEGQARFEKRREKIKSRSKNGKRKSIKDKDWILKKKNVRCRALLPLTVSNGILLALPSTRKGGRTSRFKIHRSQAEDNLLSLVFASGFPSFFRLVS